MNLVRAVQAEGGGWYVQRGWLWVRGHVPDKDVWPNRGRYVLNGFATHNEALARCMELVLTKGYIFREEVPYGA